MTVSDVEAFLRGLGRSSNQVAESLKKMGIKGARCIPQSCPLAEAIRRECGAKFVHVGGEAVAYRTDATEPYTPVLAPAPCVDFIRTFDRGGYPELVR